MTMIYDLILFAKLVQKYELETTRRLWVFAAKYS